MRLSTKIILGIILFVFVASLVFIVGFSFTDRAKHNKMDMFFVNQKDSITINVLPYKVICIDYDTRKYIDREPSINARADGKIKVCPLANDAQLSQFSFPKEAKKFISTKIGKDTLFITIDRFQMAALLESKNFQGKYAQLNGVNFTIYTANVDIKNSISTIDTDIYGLKLDFIKVNVKGKTIVDSCVTEKMDVIRGDLVLKNSITKQLNIDLDKVKNWKVNSCQIDEENLSAKGHARVYLPRTEAKKMNWCPKDKGARLEVKLSGDSAQIVFK